jgi:transposase InsO family protein
MATTAMTISSSAWRTILSRRTSIRRRIDSFIADVYNKERLHSVLGYQSLLEFEAAFAQNKAR